MEPIDSTWPIYGPIKWCTNATQKLVDFEPVTELDIQQTTRAGRMKTHARILLSEHEIGVSRPRNLRISITCNCCK